MTPAVVCLLATGALLAAEWRQFRPGVWIAKPIAAAAFLAAAVGWGALESPYGRVLLGGLALCALGDVLLIPRDREPLFRAGLFAFLSGHVCYALAFLQLGIAALPTAVAGACFAVVGFLAWRWMDPHLPTGMRVPVLLYLLVIGGMVAAAWGSGPPLGSGGGLPLAAVGATGFAISDLFVARERFVTPGFANAALGLPLYFGSQLVLAATAATA